VPYGADVRGRRGFGRRRSRFVEQLACAAANARRLERTTSIFRDLIRRAMAVSRVKVKHSKLLPR
jgi:hypothetical protein